MKNTLKAVLLVFGIFLSSMACKSKPTLQTVPEVDLMKYSGTWYSIASYPQFFERGCSDVKATYTLKNGYVEVFNESIKEGKPNNITGKAFVVPKSGNAKLKVQFFWPFKGNYWIINLADDYSWAVVSDPKQKTLWILARKSTLSADLYDKIVEKLVDKGFQKNKIVKMVHK